jgi:hypothetical protein
MSATGRDAKDERDLQHGRAEGLRMAAALVRALARDV